MRHWGESPADDRQDSVTGILGLSVAILALLCVVGLLISGSSKDIDGAFLAEERRTAPLYEAERTGR